MELANGGTARITEARGFGYGRPSSYISGFYGTKGSYEFSNVQHILQQKVFGTGKEYLERKHKYKEYFLILDGIKSFSKTDTDDTMRYGNTFKNESFNTSRGSIRSDKRGLRISAIFDARKAKNGNSIFSAFFCI